MTTKQEKEKSRLLRDGAFESVNRNEPYRVQVVRRKHGEEAARKMKAAIALDEARAKGAKI
jgi:hypothetical protein